MSHELKIDDRVHFLGHVHDVPGLLAASDLFCYPSLADGLPNAVVEAMAMGLPVIASAVGGIPELITDGENGLLVAPQDVRQLARSIARLLDDESLAARLGARAATSVRAQLDFNACCEAWEASVAAEHDAFQRQHESRRANAPADAVASTLPVMMLLNHLRTGGEETEAAILAKYVDRTRYPISVLTAWPVGEPSPAATRLRRHGRRDRRRRARTLVDGMQSGLHRPQDPPRRHPHRHRLSGHEARASSVRTAPARRVPPDRTCRHRSGSGSHSQGVHVAPGRRLAGDRARGGAALPRISPNASAICRRLSTSPTTSATIARLCATPTASAPTS